MSAARTILTQQRIQKCFIAGARNTVKGIQGLGIITGDYDNAAKGREAASTLIGNGADVIWHAADVTGLGAIQGAVAGKAKVMGCYSDQTNLAPNNMATSFEMNLEGMVQTVAHAVANRHLRGRHGVEADRGLDVAVEGRRQWRPQSALGFCSAVGCISESLERSFRGSDRPLAWISKL